MSRYPFGASNKEGTCLWCGRKLRRPCWTTYEETDKPPRRCSFTGWASYEHGGRKICKSTTFKPEGRGWNCSEGHYNSAVRRVKERRPRYAKPGDYGDGFVCGLNCGYHFAVNAARTGFRFKPKKGD